MNDIRSGMTDDELMKKYRLTAKGLESLFQKLVEAGLLEESFLLKQTAAAPADAKSTESPAPIRKTTGHQSPEAPELFRRIAREIKEGLHDSEIMRRHELSPGKLSQIKSSLVQEGLLEAEYLGPPGGEKTKRCPFCSQEIKESAVRCPHCERLLEGASSAEHPAAAPPMGPRDEALHEEDTFDDEKGCPWEERENYGTINAYFQTATKCLVTPTAFFSQLPTSGGYLNPILFGAMTLPIALGLTYLWIGLFTGAGLRGFFGFLFAMSLLFVMGIIAVPISFGIWSGILHLCLYLVGGAREGYQATFRVVSYSSVAGIFNAIPFVGTLASLWGLVLTVIGLRETHRTTTGKAVAALLIPLGIAALFAILVVLTVGAKVWFGLSKPVISQEYSHEKLPAQLCSALDTYISRVDAATSLDAKSAQAEVRAAATDLETEVKAFPKDATIAVVRQKALLFGIASLAGGQLGGKVDELRQDLRKMCQE